MARQSPKPKVRAREAAQRRNKGLWVGAGAAAVLLLVVLVVLASQNSSSKGGATGPVAASPPSKGGEVGGRVGKVSMTSLDSKTVSLPGARPGALFFSVSSCTTCIPSAMALASVKKRVGSKVDALFISMDPNDTPDAMLARRDSIGDPPYPFAIDTSGQLGDDYRILALGTVVIYDKKGKIISRTIDPTLGDLESDFRKTGVL